MLRDVPTLSLNLRLFKKLFEPSILGLNYALRGEDLLIILSPLQ